MKDNNQSETFKKYQRTAIAEMRHVTESDILFMAKDMKHSTVQYPISISAADKENGSPKMGDMIARNPENHSDQWLVAEQYFKDNFGEMQPALIVIEGKDIQMAATYFFKERYLGTHPPKYAINLMVDFYNHFSSSTSNALLLEKAMEALKNSETTIKWLMENCKPENDLYQDFFNIPMNQLTEIDDLLNQYNESLKQTK